VDSPQSAAVEKTEAEKTSDGVLVKVTFVNGVTAQLELHCVGAVDLIMQIGKVLDIHRQEMAQTGGG
jgi:hypothetical protein